ncbi:YczE/YyaS/YitT family protein [Proteocatella sphenisci]|uniref:YczE/YyaS/YitT family protein n=1 Tax=Proteocatella sphenisci TaxID=181070 RepID=UPI00048D4639|nr:membrane protein [Proteocatella sphenisci]
MNETQRRIFMTIAGVLISGFSVGIFNLALFGMDPFQVLAHGIWMHTPIGYGTFYTIVNLLMLIGIFFIDKSKIGLGTLINIFLLGYVVQFSSWMFNAWIPDPILIIRIIALIAGIVIICFGSAMYFTGDMGVSTYDAVALIMEEKKIGKFQYCRMGTDLVCTVTGFFLGATVGVGTVITALFMGPIIAFFNKNVAIPFRYGKKTITDLK